MTTLYLLATPLGNLEDISARQSRVLSEVDLILAEDTRHTRKLLSHLGIAAGGDRLWALHRHNEQQQTQSIIERLLASEGNAALVSDAGTPAIADPGAVLVAAAHVAGITVSPIVGPSALAAALSVCGFHTENVRFVGFVREKKRRERLADLARDPACVVMYVAPHDLRETLKPLAVHAPDRQVCLCRELTKMYEDVRCTTIAALLEEVAGLKVKVRGEITLVLAPLLSEKSAEPKATDALNLEVDAALRRCLKAGLSRRDAAQAVALSLDVQKRMVMARCNDLR